MMRRTAEGLEGAVVVSSHHRSELDELGLTRVSRETVVCGRSNGAPGMPIRRESPFPSDIFMGA